MSKTDGSAARQSPARRVAATEKVAFRTEGDDVVDDDDDVVSVVLLPSSRAIRSSSSRAAWREDSHSASFCFFCLWPS